MAEMITQCPKCSTAFHVTDELLASAKGSVRCGSCMTVFNGRAHLLKNEEKEKHNEGITQVDLDKELNELDDLELKLDSVKDTNDEPVNKNIDSDDNFKVENKPEDEDIAEVSEDESWVLDLLEEEGHDASQIGLVKKEESEEDEQEEENGQAGNPVTNQLLESIEPESVEISYRGKRSFFRTKLGMLVMIVACAAILGGQVAWMKYDELNKTEPYRSYYSKICGIIGCELPELIDRSKIKTSNLLVRSHPKKDDALLVEVLVKNEAAFEQPFPKLTLQFKDLKNIVVARRTFQPEDYLAGEAANLKFMPVNQPVRIKMELVDPGEGAVSYDMSIEK